MNKLSPVETTLFSKLESTIKQTQGAFVACGRALSEIQAGKLYREKYDTFEKYCETKWGWKKSHVYRLIESAKVVKQIESSPMGDIIKNERQARALADVPPDSRIRVLKAAVKAGDVTASGITHAASSVLEKTVGPVMELDKTGHPVPEPALPFWARSGEAEDLLLHISRVKAAVKELQDKKDPFWVEVDANGAYADACNLYNNIKLAVPYAVCPVCQGQTPKTCTLCAGRGVISKFRYDTAIPQELKEIRGKRVKKFAAKALGEPTTPVKATA